MRKIVPTAVLLSLLAAGAHSQQQPYIETFEVRLHNLDVVVTGAKGNHAAGLTRDDFEILEDGKPQPITNFSEYAQSSGSASAESTATLDAGELFQYRTDLVVAQGRTRIAVGVLDEVSKLSGFSTVEVQAK